MTTGFSIDTKQNYGELIAKDTASAAQYCLAIARYPLTFGSPSVESMRTNIAAKSKIKNWAGIRMPVDWKMPTS